VTNPLQISALASWILLGILCLLWESWWAPSTYAPASLWTAIKAVPIALLLPGLFARGHRTYVYACLVTLLYFSEGVMLAWSEQGLVRFLALAEILLVLVFFTTAALHVRRVRIAEAAGS